MTAHSILLAAPPIHVTLPAWVQNVMLVGLGLLVAAAVLVTIAELVIITVNKSSVRRQVLADYGIKISGSEAENLSEPVKGNGIMHLGDNRALKYDRNTGRADLVEYEYTEKKVAAR